MPKRVEPDRCNSDSSRGTDAARLGRTAERDFDTLLDTVFEDAGGPLTELPDRVGVDRSVVIDSRWKLLRATRIRFQVKARSVKPTYAAEYGLKALRVGLGPSEQRSLDRGLADANSPLIFVVSILHDRGPAGPRCLHYGVDLTRYLSRVGARTVQDVASVAVPTVNLLTPATLTLLWASHVARSLVHHTYTTAADGLARITESLHTLETSSGNKDDRWLLAAPEMDPGLIQEAVCFDPSGPAAYLLGTTVALGWVARYLAAKGPGRGLLALAPDTLSEEATMWLFNRAFRCYLRLTIANATPGSATTRFFPNPLHLDPRCPLYRRLLTYFTLQGHLRLGAQAMLVNHACSSDTLVLPGVGVFPMDFYSTEHAFAYAAAPTRHGFSESNDLLLALQKQSTGVRDALAELRLHPDDVLLGSRPIDLFPRETHLIEHPAELWSSPPME